MQLAPLPATFIVYRFLLPAIVGKGISSKFTYVCARRLNLIESAPCEAVPEAVHVLELDDGALAHADLAASFESDPQDDESEQNAEHDGASCRAAGLARCGRGWSGNVQVVTPADGCGLQAVLAVEEVIQRLEVPQDGAGAHRGAACHGP